MFLSLLALVNNNDVFGKIDAPAGVKEFDASPGATNGLGLILFFSNMIKIATVIAGLWVFINIIMAGMTYISAAGDSGTPDKVKDQILHSVIGLAIIVLSYLIIALISFVLFKDPGYILNPTIIGPGA